MSVSQFPSTHLIALLKAESYIDGFLLSSLSGKFSKSLSLLSSLLLLLYTVCISQTHKQLFRFHCLMCHSDQSLFNFEMSNVTWRSAMDVVKATKKGKKCSKQGQSSTFWSKGGFR